MKNLSDYREKKEGVVSPKTLVKNLLTQIEESGDIEGIIYVAKQKDGTVVCGHSTDLPIYHVGLLEVGKRIMVDSMLVD